jgi:hypothetical protein
MIDTFFDRGMLMLPRFPRNDLLDRIIAQHYAVPTQLLDWTLDPFIGLYFATQDIKNEADGALYYIRPLRLIDSSSDVYFPFTDNIAQVNPPILDQRVGSQKSVFTLQSFGDGDTFVPLDDRQLKFSAPMAGTGHMDQDESIGKVIIPHEHKQQIRYQLMKLGIDSGLLFPGLQGIGERIASLAEIQKYGGDGLF